VYIRRLQYQVVKHACGHFEARLMAPTGELINIAGSPCTVCDPQGRPVRPNYPDALTADEACDTLNTAAGRA